MARDETALVQLQVRLREDLRRFLEGAAQARRVPLNTEIVGRLEHTRDRSNLTMEVLALAYGREVASILLLLGAIMWTEGLARAGVDWADDADAYTVAVDYAVTALMALRPGAAPPRHMDEETWTQVAGMVDQLAGGNLTNRVSKRITEYRQGAPKEPAAGKVHSRSSVGPLSQPPHDRRRPTGEVGEKPAPSRRRR